MRTRSDRADFSVRELEVLHLLALGLSDEEIGENLAISPNTVKWHQKSVRNKLRNRKHPRWTRDQLVQIAQGLSR